jgi:hypothetical protein
MTSNLDPPSQPSEPTPPPGWIPPGGQPVPPQGWTPPSAPPPAGPAKRGGIRKRWIVLAVVVAFLGIGLFRNWQQEQEYNAGHKAYLAADCTTAVGPLGSVAKGSSGSSGNDVELKARAELQECDALLEADDLAVQGQPGDAVLAYSAMVTKYPRSPLKDAALASGRKLIATAPDKVASVKLCDALEALEAQGFVAGEPDPLPPLLFSCGGAYEAADAHADAVAIYARFRADYPDHDLAEDVEIAFARATLAETENGAGELLPPDKGPGTGTEGVATIIIQNDSPDPLSMVFSGPDIRVEDLEACTDCVKIPGAIYECRDPDQSPVAEYKVAPGVYEVVVRGSGSNVRPFRGTWTLEDGEVYASCFYISSGP